MIVVLVLVGGAIYAIINKQDDVTIGPAVRPIELTDLGVRITVPAVLSDLATEPISVPHLGTVLSMQASSIPGGTPGRGCELGVMYYLPKENIDDVGFDEGNLKMRAQGATPQVKEFDDAYFILEPSQEPCTTDSAQQAQESAKRKALLQSVTSAERI